MRRNITEKVKRGLAIGVSIGLLAGSVSPSAAAAQTPGAADLTPDGRGAYVSMAGGSDLYMIRAGRLASERARRPEVREFAGNLIVDYQRTTDRLLDGARALGMDALPPAMMPMYWDMLRKLERASNSRFDALFLRQQMRAHELALALHRNYSLNGDAPSLRGVAAEAISVIERHLSRARQLRSSG